MQSQYIHWILLRTAVSVNDPYYQEENTSVLTSIYNTSAQQSTSCWICVIFADLNTWFGKNRHQRKQEYSNETSPNWFLPLLT